MLNKQLTEAGKLIEETIQKTGDTPIMKALRGLYLAESGREDEALGCFALALDRLPRDTAILFNVAVILRKKGLLVAAEEAINRLLRIAPMNPVAHFELARIYTDQQQHSKAVMSLFKSIQIDNRFLPGYLALGVYLDLDGRRDLAIKLYEVAVASAPDEPFFRKRLVELKTTSREKNL